MYAMKHIVVTGICLKTWKRQEIVYINGGGGLDFINTSVIHIDNTGLGL